VGILPFFLLAVAFVWLLGRQLFGDTAALFATVLLAALPPILAHAGLATTDMACAASFLAALFTFSLWLKNPDVFRSCILWSSLALAVLAKLSNLPFLSASIAVVFLMCVSGLIDKRRAMIRLRRWVTGFCTLMLVGFFSVWSLYWFSTSPLTTLEERPHSMIDRIVGEMGPLHDTSYAILEAPICPLRELYDGVVQLIARDQGETPTHFLGNVYDSGQRL
jgi:hypothetical protein